MKDKKPENRIFHWQGINSLGETISGALEARDKPALIEALRKQEILFKKIIKTKVSKVKALRPQDLACLSRQLATMLSAGIPLTQSFDLIAKGEKQGSLQRIVADLKEGVSSGLSLKESLERHPSCFNALFCNLVDAGEKSGTLDIMLQKIADYQEKFVLLKKKIKNALLYPIAIISLALLITVVLLIVVVPQFESLFHEFGASMPLLTRCIIALSKLVQEQAVLLCPSIGMMIYAFLLAKKYYPSFSKGMDKALLHLPIFGALISKACIARFSRTFAISYAAGIAPMMSLEIAAKAANHPFYAEATGHIRAQVASGLAIHSAMANTQAFPQLLIQMIAIGEESGALENMLLKVALLYEEEVDDTIHSLSSLLEPVIMSVLGILVGGLCLAMYLPIFQLGTLI